MPNNRYIVLLFFSFFGRRRGRKDWFWYTCYNTKCRNVEIFASFIDTYSLLLWGECQHISWYSDLPYILNIFFLIHDFFFSPQASPQVRTLGSVLLYRSSHQSTHVQYINAFRSLQYITDRWRDRETILVVAKIIKYPGWEMHCYILLNITALSQQNNGKKKQQNFYHLHWC